MHTHRVLNRDPPASSSSSSETESGRSAGASGLTMDPAVPIYLLIGFALRTFLLAFDRHSQGASQLRPVFVGTWEGIALYRALSTAPESQLTAYLACAVRLVFDFTFTDNMPAMMIILFSLVCAFLISDAVGSYHNHIQARHREDLQRRRVSGTCTTQVYEIPQTPRLNRRARFVIIPQAGGQDEAAAVISPVVHEKVNRARIGRGPGTGAPPLSPAVHGEKANRDAYQTLDSISPVAQDEKAGRADHSPSAIDDSPSPRPVHTVGVYLPTPNPVTPRIYRRPVAQDLDPESHNNESDELQTPPALATRRDLSFWPDPLTLATGEAFQDASPREEDELQTPLALGLRNLPPVVDSPASPRGQPDEGRLLVSEGISSKDEVAGADGVDSDNASELSITGTQLSTISDADAQRTIAKAERLRQQAWDEKNKKIRLEQDLIEAVAQRRTKDAFLLRIEIEAAEERAQRIHSSAARRHYSARNLRRKEGEIDVHGLFVPEAIKKVKIALQTAIRDGRKDVHVIVGRGLNSKDNRPRLRPAIIDEMKKYNIPCQIQASNPGMLVLTVPS